MAIKIYGINPIPEITKSILTKRELIQKYSATPPQTPANI